MIARFLFVTLKQLIRDTFRQARSSGILWIMLAGTAIAVLFCLSVSVSDDVSLHAKDEPGFFVPKSAGIEPDKALKEGVVPISGRMTLGFGIIAVDVARERRDSIHFLELLLAGGFAGTLGLLLALVWTSGFVPSFLEASSAAVLLAKPVARWQLLLGKYLGVLTFVAFQAVLFVMLTWFAIGIRTDIWDATYWWCIPLMLLQFAIYYSFSVLIGVITRNTAAAIFGSLIFWLLAWGINYGAVMVRPDPPARIPSILAANVVGNRSSNSLTSVVMAASAVIYSANRKDSEAFSPVSIALSEAAYWISPKPIDGGLLLFNALDSKNHFAKPDVFTRLEFAEGFSPVLSILSSLLITIVLLALSAYEFHAMDY